MKLASSLSATEIRNQSKQHRLAGKSGGLKPRRVAGSPGPAGHGQGKGPSRGLTRVRKNSCCLRGDGESVFAEGRAGSEGPFFRTHRAHSAGTAAHSPLPSDWGSWPPPQCRHGALLPSAAELPGILALLLGPAVSVLPSERLSKPGIGQGGKVDLKEDQVRKDGWGRKNEGMRKGQQRKEPGSSTHGALLRRGLLCSAYPWGGKGMGRNRLKPPCRL